MKADEKKPEATRYCKDCRHYSRPTCNIIKYTEPVFVARKCTCPMWARR